VIVFILLLCHQSEDHFLNHLDNFIEGAVAMLTDPLSKALQAFGTKLLRLRN